MGLALRRCCAQRKPILALTQHAPAKAKATKFKKTAPAAPRWPGLARSEIELRRGEKDDANEQLHITTSRPNT